MKKMSKILALMLLVCSFSVIFSACDNTKYNLTAEDSQGYLIEELKDSYSAGESVTVKIGILYDANLTVYLNGEKLNDKKLIDTEGNSHWEYYFVMPSHDVVISFEVDDGFLPEEPNIDKEIKIAYLNRHPDLNLTESDIELYHYGEFNGTYVFIMSRSDCDVAQVITYETVDDITFCFAEDISFDVYREGDFYTLQEAFDLGYLTHDDLYAVWDKHRAENYILYNSGPRELNEAETKEIKAAYMKMYPYPRLTENNIKLRCFGSFKGVYVLFVDEADAQYADVLCYETVSGVEFVYSNTQFLTVYFKGEFCSLTEAFAKGLLTHEELLIVQKNRREGRYTIG